MKITLDCDQSTSFVERSTGILIFTKGEPTENVWFYDMEADGYSLDDKEPSLMVKGIFQILLRNIKIKIQKNWKIKRNGFTVPLEEIKENDYSLSISNYKEIEYEEIEYEAPEFIKAKILELEEKIINGLKIWRI